MPELCSVWGPVTDQPIFTSGWQSVLMMAMMLHISDSHGGWPAPLHTLCVEKESGGCRKAGVVRQDHPDRSSEDGPRSGVLSPVERFQRLA